MKKELTSSLALILLFVFFGCATTGGDRVKAQKINTPDTYDELVKKYNFMVIATYISLEEFLWHAVMRNDTPAAYEFFLKKFPDGRNSAMARQRLMESVWKTAQSLNIVQAYQDFIGKYPTSEYARQARDFLSERRVDGWIQSVNLKEMTITIKTSKGQFKTLVLDSRVEIKSSEAVGSLEDLKSGESVAIYYNILAGKKAVSRKIVIGY